MATFQTEAKDYVTVETERESRDIRLELSAYNFIVKIWLNPEEARKLRAELMTAIRAVEKAERDEAKERW
jgi:hypothetical protein